MWSENDDPWVTQATTESGDRRNGGYSTSPKHTSVTFQKENHVYRVLRQEYLTCGFYATNMANFYQEVRALLSLFLNTKSQY